MAVKRQLRKPSEIRSMFEESEMKFVMLNNRLFDDFYSKGKVDYNPILSSEKDGDFWIDYKGKKHPYSQCNTGKYWIDDKGKKQPYQATFDERDFILVIFLKFLSQHNFQGYTQEIADYLFPSVNGQNDKRLKERLKKLSFLQGTVNNIYNQKEQKRIMHPDGISVSLVNEEKVEGYEDGTTKTKRIFYKWHLNFDCDYKKETDKEGKEKLTPINFFKATIYDLDLYTSGLLNEKEFITYLYFIRSYNGDNKIWHSLSALSEKLNIKDISIVEKIVDRLLVVRVKDQFVTKEIEDFPLLHADFPANYNRKIKERQQPSAYYKPVYNMQMCLRLNEVENTNPYEQSEVDEVPIPSEEDVDLSFLEELN